MIETILEYAVVGGACLLWCALLYSSHAEMKYRRDRWKALEQLIDKTR